MRNAQGLSPRQEVSRQRLLETGYRLFTGRTIDGVSLEEIAREAGIGIATLYRWFGSKTELAVAVSVWKWEDFLRELPGEDPAARQDTGAEGFARYLDSFLDLYRNHRDLLRYNQFFNVYLQSARDDSSAGGHLAAYEKVIGRFAARFRQVWEKGCRDGTLCTEIPWTQVFSATLHIMMAAVTRYAVGLVYLPEGSAAPEEELCLLRDLMLRRYAR